MSSTMKNIVVILLALTAAFAAYYFYIQDKNMSLDTDGGVDVTDEILMNTQLFIEHRTTLSAIQMNTDIFENEVFLSYQTFAKPLPDESYGRQNPFANPSLQGQD